jgi:hypothetical protein
MKLIRESEPQKRSAPQTQVAQSPAAYLRRAIRAGLLWALVLALALTVLQLDISRECRGPFSSGFSSGFDAYRCELIVRKIGTTAQFRIPLP